MYAHQSSLYLVQTRRSYPTPPAPTADTASLKLDASPGCVGRSAQMTKKTESSAMYRRTDVSISRVRSMRRPATSKETSASWLSLTYRVALGRQVSLRDV